MSGFDNLEKSIKKKLTLQDYKAEMQQTVKTADKKTKITIYLSEDSMRMLNEVCSKNILKNGRQDKSVLMSKAVKLLYDKVVQDE